MGFILHIDTSTDTGVVAISNEGQLIGYRLNEESRNHAGTLSNMIKDLMTSLQVSFNQLGAVDICGGPGSYTGLRIGMATAKGICYALDIPLIADNRITLLCHQAFLGNRDKYAQYITLLIAREKEYFIGIYDNKFNSIMPPQHIMQSDLLQKAGIKKDSYLITDDHQMTDMLAIPDLYIANNAKIDLESWITYASEKYYRNDIVTLSVAEPFYLKQVYTHK